MEILDYFELPDACKYHATLTKVFFRRNFALTLVDKKFLEDASIFQEIKLYGSIKPDNSNIQSYLSELETYEEIAFISVKTDANTFDQNHQKVAHFIQKYIPYHLVVVVQADDSSKYSLHLAPKQISKNNKDERVIKEIIGSPVLKIADTRFLSYFTLAKQIKVNLQTLYNSFIALLYSRQIEQITNRFEPLLYDEAMKRIVLFRSISVKERDLIVLRTQIKKESQLNEQIKLNTEIHLLREELKDLTNKLLQNT